MSTVVPSDHCKGGNAKHDSSTRSEAGGVGRVRETTHEGHHHGRNMAAPDQQAPNSFGSFPNQPGPRTFTYYPNESLRRLWQEAKDEIAMTEPDPAHFKNQTLPLARIKKIMKSDEDVRMISAEAPVLFAKACEFFVLELTQRAWQAAEENKRRTLQRNDVAMAIQHIDVFDFLLDIVPYEEPAPDGAGVAAAQPPPSPAQPGAGAPPTAVHPVPGQGAAYHAQQAGPGGYGTSPRFLQTQGMQYPQYHPSMGPPPQAGMFGSGGGQQQFVAPYHQPMAPVGGYAPLQGAYPPSGMGAPPGPGGH
ncbi:hypothetical protein ACKKBG_A17035 [Auxenochlorella protothecoides x Auxenochlorella symbiontica]